MPLTVVFLHRDPSYARSVSERLIACATPEDSLFIQHAADIVEAASFLPSANRLLFDLDDFVNVLSYTQDVPSYALTNKLDAALSAELFKRGAIAVGTCTTERDVEALAAMIISGVVAVPRPSHVLEYLATPGRYALIRAQEDDAILKTTLELTRYNVTETAKLLGFPRSTIQSQMKKLGLVRRTDDS